MAIDVGVAGAGYSAPETFTDFRKSRNSKTELTAESIKSALNHAGLTKDDLDASIFTTVDGFEAHVRIERTMDVFGQDRNIPVMSVNTGGSGGASALTKAYEFVGAGKYDAVLVVGSTSFDSVVQGQQVMNTAAPPLFEKPFISGIHMGLLYHTKYMETYDMTEEDIARMAEKNYRAAAKNPWAHRNTAYSLEEIMESEMIAYPLRRLETCPVSSGSGAMIVAREEIVENLHDDPVWLDDISNNTNTFLSGYRTYKGFPLMKELAERMYAKAGITDPLEQFDILETFNPYIGFEFMHYEALGLCDEGEGVELFNTGVTDMDGDLPVNPSGGTFCTNSGICASLSRHIEVVLQMMGDAGERQIEGDIERGLAHSWGANIGQFQTLALFSK